MEVCNIDPAHPAQYWNLNPGLCDLQVDACCPILSRPLEGNTLGMWKYFKNCTVLCKHKALATPFHFSQKLQQLFLERQQLSGSRF